VREEEKFECLVEAGRRGQEETHAYRQKGRRRVEEKERHRRTAGTGGGAGRAAGEHRHAQARHGARGNGRGRAGRVVESDPEGVMKARLSIRSQTDTAVA